MSEELHLALLGDVEIQWDNTPLPGMTSAKALALLCYLAVTGRPHLRPALAGLLWPEMPEASARTNLRKALAALRRLVGSHLIITRQAIAFNRDCPYQLDVETFEGLVGNVSSEPDMTRLDKAITLYRGDFLEGFYVRQAPGFEEWVGAQRARLRVLALQALHRLALYHARRGEAGHAESIDHTTRLLALEPWREEAHRQLMLLLAQSGQRGAALAQYEVCRQVLAEELGVEPGAETQALYERIRDEQMPAGFEPALGQPHMVSANLRDLPPPCAAPPPFLSSPGLVPALRAPFIARKRELAQLDSFLVEVLHGRGRVAFVAGEAGVGKTFLVEEFTRRAQETHADLIVAGGYCNAYAGAGDPYLPFRQIMALLTGDVEGRWAAGTMSVEQANRLWNLTPASAQAIVSKGPDLLNTFIAGQDLATRVKAAVLGGGEWLDRLEELIAAHESTNRQADSGQTDLFGQYGSVLAELGGKHPLLLVMDDLQWADRGSISLLFHLGRQIAESRVLIVGIYRPADVAMGRDGERHPLEPVISELQRRFGQMNIDLGQSEDRQFVEELLDSEPNRLDARFRDALFQHTRGHPLFTIEMLRAMQNRGDMLLDEEGRWTEGAALDWDSLPPRVEGIIGERVNRLPVSAREILGVASVEGEEFTAEVVAKVRGANNLEIIRQLGSELGRQHRLVRGQSSQRVGPGRRLLSRYRFRHILFQRYLYNSLDDAERAFLHEAVGNALEELHEGRTERVAIYLARHYREAGITSRAIDYSLQAGEQAMRSHAYHEALSILEEALALLGSLPESHDRSRKELDLQLAWGNAALVVKGFGAPEVEEAYSRVRELCWNTVAEDAPKLFPALWGLSCYYFTRAEYQASRELGGQLLRLAELAGDGELRLQANHAMWTSLFATGEFAMAHAHVEQAAALYDSLPEHSPVFRYGGHDTKVCGLLWGGPALWCLGYPERALRRSQEALALAQEKSDPVSLAQTHKWVAALHQFRRERESVRQHAEEAVAIADEYELPLWVGWAMSLQGWAIAARGQAEEGIAQIRQGMATCQATGMSMDRPYMLALLAEALQAAGQLEQALSVLTTALATVAETGECYYEAELHRLRGELLLALSPGMIEAEACFQRAIEIAREQSAKSLELRATTSLCRLWQKHGRNEQALLMLGEIYGWFSEGFDTADLIEAKALLEALV